MTTRHSSFVFVRHASFGPTSLYLSSDPSNSGPYSLAPWHLSLGVFIYGHIIGTIYNYIGIVIGCAIIFHLAECTGLSSSNLWSVRRPTTSTLAELQWRQAVRPSFIFMMIWPISPWLHHGRSEMTFIIILLTLVIYTWPDLYHRLFLENGLKIGYKLFSYRIIQKTRRRVFLLLTRVSSSHQYVRQSHRSQ